MDFAKESCERFVSALASNAPTPGGGGAAALVGAIGTALGNMVGSLTIGKKRYADVEEEILACMQRCDALQEELLQKIEADAEGFAPLAAAYGLQKDDPNRAAVLESATLTACDVPVRIMELCCDAIDTVAVFAEKGSRLAVSDAGCAAACLKAALQAASLNVFINTKTLQDRETAQRLNDRCFSMIEVYGTKADAVFSAVRDSFFV